MRRVCWCRGVVCWFALLVALAALAALPTARAGESPVTITYTTTLLTESAGPEIQRQIGEFEKANPGIKVEPEPSPYETYPVKLASRFRAGEAPDIVGAERDWLWGWMNQGFLLDLNPLNAKAGGKAFLDNYFSMLITLATTNGKLYALPRHAGGFMLYYNTDLFKEAGLNPAKPPTNWAEFLTAAKKLTKKDAAGNTVQWGYGMHGQNITPALGRFINWLYSNGADVCTPDNKQGTLDQPKAIETLKFWSELYTKEKVVPPGAVNAGPGDNRTLFAQKKIAMLIGILEGVDQTLAQNPALKSSLMVAPTPKQAPHAGSNFQAMYDTISASSKHPAEAWKLLQWFGKPENQLALFKVSRYGPTRRDVFRLPAIASDPYAKVLGQVNENLTVGGCVTSPHWEQINKILGDAMQQTLNGTKAPEVAFKDANAQVNQLLK